MATNSVQEKWDHSVKEEEECEEEECEEEEEALSLCDLPVTLMNDKDQDKTREQDACFSKAQEEEEGREFVFRSWGGLFAKEPEMCAADEVFFKGQILPLRHSFSFESASLTKGSEYDGNIKNQFNPCESRSESMDRGSLGEFRSSSSSSRRSSRSSSLRSQNSSSSTSSTVTATATATVTVTATTTNPKVSELPQIRNQFHSIPSPKPQLRQSSSISRKSVSLGSTQSRKSSSPWEFFRLGVVPTPEIGLQDLKVRNSANRNCVSRNSSSSSSSNSICNNSAIKSSAKVSSSKKGRDGDKSNHVFKQFVGKGGGLLSGCSCSVETVLAQLDTNNNSNNNKSAKKKESATHAVKEKVVDLKKQKKQQHNNNNSSSNRQKQVKKVTSRRRTFEWLKELHASQPEEEALLLSNS